MNGGLKRVLGANRGSQLVEFAVVMPILLAVAVGVADLTGAFVIRDKPTNAAREGARIAIGQAAEDRTQAFPPSVQGVRDAVVGYVQSAINPAISAGACTAAAGSTATWTCGLSNGGQIQIAREFPVAVNGVWVMCTKVMVSYPYSWSLGKAMGLLGSSTIGNSVTISSQSVMTNLR